MPFNLQKHLFVAISFKLMAIKIVVKVEHLTAIILQWAFKDRPASNDSSHL